MNKEANKAIEETKTYIEFYKAGYLDGFTRASPAGFKIVPEDLGRKCIKSFQKRFKIKVKNVDGKGD